ncbi:ELM2 domain-containing protein [Tanacetum coccineum]
MLEMGEVAAAKWTEEEERLFHEVVYLNPASVGGRFWKELSIEFPSRTKKEIVSYYFNVFILRRRAVQNRSQVLYPDSDNDEWRQSYGGTFGDKLEDGDFVLGDPDSSSDDDDNDDGGEHDSVIGVEDSAFPVRKLM